MFAHRIFLGAAMLCCLANVVFSQEPLTGFNIGSTPTSADIAYDGQGVGEWAGGSIGPYQAGPMDWPPAFYYLWLDQTRIPVETVTVKLTGTLSGAVEFNLTETTVVLTKGERYYPMEADLLCSEEGRAVGHLTITITDPPNYSPISLYIQKDCDIPLFNIGFPCEFGLCKVVDDNIVDPAWSYILGKTEQIPLLYIWVNGSVVPWAEFSIYVSNDHQDNVVQSISLPYGTNATVYGTQHPALGLGLTCQVNRLDSLINVTVTLVPKHWDMSFPNNTVVFHIGKRCGDLTGNNRVGFNIGTTPQGNDVVSNGLTQDKYKNFNYPFAVNPLYRPFPLYLSLSNAQAFPPNALYNLSFEEEATAVARATEQGKLASFVDTVESQEIIVDFDCLTDGVEPVKLTVDIRDSFNGTVYDHVVIFFQKECVKPEFDVIFAGDNTPIYIGNIKKAWTYTSPASTLTDTFIIGLNTDSEADEMNYIIDNFKYDRNFLTLDVAPAENTISGKGASAYSRVNIVYTCVLDKPSTTAVAFQVDFGWEVLIDVSYSKECNATSGSSGWNAAEIFFFVVFILLLAFFIFGSIYKYFIQQQRGWDIIPGITYYRKCCKCCPGSSARYTPQMDSDYVATEEERQSKHTNYGTTSYQPNL